MKLMEFRFHRILFLFLTITFLTFPQGNLYAQNYREKLFEDSIRISYKWRKNRILKKGSPYVLLLQIENLSSSKCAVSFSVLYYWKAQLHSGSGRKAYCIKPGRKIKGKVRGLAFYSPVFSPGDYLDPMFSWYIDELEVRTDESCDPGLKIMFEPAYPIDKYEERP